MVLAGVASAGVGTHGHSESLVDLSSGSGFQGDAQLLHGGGGFSGHHGNLDVIDLSGGGHLSSGLGSIGSYHGAALLALGGGGGFDIPKAELIDLGSVGTASTQIFHAEVPPPKTIRITKTVAIKVPVPYPVRNDIPIPVHIPKPVPIPVPYHAPIAAPVPSGGGGPAFVALVSAPAPVYGNAAPLAAVDGGYADTESHLDGSHSDQGASGSSVVGVDTIQRAINAAEAVEANSKMALADNA